MIDNAVLKAIKERRSIIRFKQEPVSNDQIQTILEAGRWAPSFANSQPWTFIVIKDDATKKALVDVVERVTLAREGVAGAPVLIALVADPMKDPRHYVEAGAVAAQNMALAAHSLGLASYWVGVYDAEKKRNSAEAHLKKALGVPKDMRLIALLPIGVPAVETKKPRLELVNMVRYEKFS